MRPIRQLTTELTFRCNARCPACHRQKPLSIDLNAKRYTISLENFKKLSPGKLELSESVEMLRFLENGFPVKMVKVKDTGLSVDAPKDIQFIEKFLKNTK